MREKFPNYTPQQVAQYLKDNAAGRGATGPDYTWGHGFAVLPPIGGCSNNPGLAAGLRYAAGGAGHPGRDRDAKLVG